LNLHQDYTRRSLEMPVADPQLIIFTVVSPDPFYVSLDWPSDRFLRPCHANSPLATLAVKKVSHEDEPEEHTQIATNNNLPLGGALSAEINLGPGKYVALVNLQLVGDAANIIKEGLFTVYAKDKDLDFYENSFPVEMSAKMLLPLQPGGVHCKTVWFPGKGLFEVQLDKSIAGVATLKSRGDFAYFVPDKDMWYVTIEEKRPEVEDGTQWAWAKLDRSALACSSGLEVIRRVVPQNNGGDLCERIQVPGSGLFELQERQTIGALPTYSTDSKFLYWVPSEERWHLTSMDKWNEVSQGVNWRYRNFTTEELKCGGLEDFLPTEGGNVCPMLLFKTQGLFKLREDLRFNGLPMYAADGNFAFLNSDRQWEVAKNEYFEAVQQRKAYRSGEVNKEDVECFNHDLFYAKIGILGPDGELCKQLFLPEEGVFEMRWPKVIRDVATYWQFETNFLYYSFHSQTWELTGAGKWKGVSAGEGWSRKSFTPNQLECIHGMQALDRVTPNARNCKVVTFPGLGVHKLNTRRTLNTVPTFDRLDGEGIAYFAGDGMWYLTIPKYWAQVSQGQLYKSESVDMEKVQCGCANAPGGVPNFQDPVTCNDVAKAKFGKDLSCKTGAKYLALIQTFCPETCPVPSCG